MSNAEMALARSILYGTAGDVLEMGLTPQSLEVLDAIDAIILPARDSINFDLEAADHYTLFGRSVLPFASTFVEPDGRLGGAVSASFLSVYGQTSWNPDSSDSAPDHFATQFRFLSFLSKLENADAEHTSALGSAAQFATAQFATAQVATAQFTASFIARYVLPGFLPFSTAVARHGNQFYSSLLGSMWALLIDQSGSMTSPGERIPVTDSADDSVDVLSIHQSATIADGDNQENGLTLDLSDPRAGVRDIAEYLTSCRRSGIYLSHEDIAQLSRRYSIPRGFGSRTMTLANLIRSAASLGELDVLLSSTTEMIQQEQKQIRQLNDQNPEIIAPIASVLDERLTTTIGVIETMREANDSATTDLSTR